jgi:hypothetical protein
MRQSGPAIAVKTGRAERRLGEAPGGRLGRVSFDCPTR